jgi:hypothetical protein
MSGCVKIVRGINSHLKKEDQIGNDVAGIHSILSAIRSPDSKPGFVSISYDSKSPHGNINNKSIPEGDKFTQLLGLCSRQLALRLVGSLHTMEGSLKIHIKE